MAQIMPAKIMNPRPQQRIAPSLGIDLNDWISLMGEHMVWVIALPLLQHIHRSLIQRHRMRPAVFVIATGNLQMAALQADLLPLQTRYVGLSKASCNRELRHVRVVLRQL